MASINAPGRAPRVKNAAEKKKKKKKKKQKLSHSGNYGAT